MLDDRNVLAQRDPDGLLDALVDMPNQVQWQPIVGEPEYDNRVIHSVVYCGLGGSALGIGIVRPLLDATLTIPLQIVRGDTLPQSASSSSLVIICSQSGTTEESLSCYQQARQRGCQIAVIAGGGTLLEQALADNVVHVQLPPSQQPRTATLSHIRAALTLLSHFNILDSHLNDELEATYDWLQATSRSWHKESPVHENYAKFLALLLVGKTPVLYSGPLTSGLGYYWKTICNETAKNVAFANSFPEFNHNEMTGWASHPIEKPYSVVDIVSQFESERVIERMKLADKLLSGRRPKATVVRLKGDTVMAEYAWGMILGQFVGAYMAVLNNVSPTRLDIVDQFKQELT